MVSVQNLGLIITNKCNLDCAHCLRGCKNNVDMSREVIDKVLSYTDAIGNLSLCGGEPTMALDTLSYIVKRIKEDEIIVENLTTTINGTVYSREFLEILKEADEYISLCSEEKKKVSFLISYDNYHLDEIKRLNLYDRYMNNIRLYMESPYFMMLQRIPHNGKIIREGNAINLDKRKTTKLDPFNIFITYTDDNYRFDKSGVCNIGPIIGVNPKGIYTDCNASILNQAKLYNYGNVFDMSVEEMALEKGKLLKPKTWIKKTEKETLKKGYY